MFQQTEFKPTRRSVCEVMVPKSAPSSEAARSNKVITEIITHIGGWWVSRGLQASYVFTYYLPALLCFSFIIAQTAFLACPREKGQLQLTRGECDSYLSPQDTLRGSPIFSARGVTLPALILLWAANHERARRESDRGEGEKQGEII